MKKVKKSIALVLALLMICGCTPADPEYTPDPTGTVSGSGPAETTASDPTETTEETKPSDEPTGSTEATAATAATAPAESGPAAEPTTPAATTPAATEPAQTTPVETQPTQTAPAVSYTEVNETVYVTAGMVNVRSGPGTEHTKLGSLSKGDSVKRVGIGDNGWSKVEYAGAPAYISTQYLSTTKPIDNSSVSYDGMEVAKKAVEYLELQYVYGGNSLTAGTDCSGFTKLIYAQFGITLPRTAAEQSKVGTAVSLADAKPGDLYAEEYSDKTNYTGHAGFYIGNGYMISAWPGGGVDITSVSEDATFRRIGTNTCKVSGEDAIHELEKHLILKNGYSGLKGGCYCPDRGDFFVYGNSPLKCGIIYDIINVNPIFVVSKPEKGYENLAEKLKETFIKSKKEFRVAGPEYEIIIEQAFSDPRVEKTRDLYGYLNGSWYTMDELKDMYNAGEIDDYEDATYFYGKPWDADSNITTGNGEIVDFSTFPV